MTLDYPEVEAIDLLIINNKAYKFSELTDGLKQLVIEKLQIPKSNYIKPPLSAIYNIKDFEEVAQKTLSKATFAYYKTGAADEITLAENERAFQRIYLKPRVLRNVSNVSLKTTILGSYTAAPFYITAFAGSSMDGNDLGELPLAKSAGENDVIQMIPCLTSISLYQLVETFNNSKVDQWLQIYLRSTFDDCIKLIREAEATGNIKTVFFTVDTAQLGRRETEARVRQSEGFKRTSTFSAELNWDGLRRIRSLTNLKIVLKGVQTVEDAIKAVEYGFNGFVISNHGGRQLDTTRSSIEILAEVVPELQKRGLYGKVEILIDGGIRRGSDVVKALALGAKGVGLGRPCLYSLQTYGESGVSKVIELLREEIELTLKLLGVNNLDELSPAYIDTLDLFGNRATNVSYDV